MVTPLFTDEEEIQVVTYQDIPTSKGHHWDLRSELSGNPSSLFHSLYLVLLRQVTVSRLMGHLECQVLTEQWAKCEESFLGIWGDFREEEVEGIADGPRGLKSLIAGDSDSCF